MLDTVRYGVLRVVDGYFVLCSVGIVIVHCTAAFSG